VVGHFLFILVLEAEVGASRLGRVRVVLNCVGRVGGCLLGVLSRRSADHGAVANVVPTSFHIKGVSLGST
jgi:hypothetical protein